jgi:anti-sigma-K factor RskA
MAMMAPETEEAPMAEATQLAYLPQIESESTSQQGNATSANGSVVSWLNPWRIAQISLASIALITGLIAVYLRRRNRA